MMCSTASRDSPLNTTHRPAGAPDPSGTYRVSSMPCCWSSRTRACSAGSAWSTSARRAVSNEIVAMNCMSELQSQSQVADDGDEGQDECVAHRSEEHTSELQS